MNTGPQRKANNLKNNPKALPKWINAIIAFVVTLFLMFYLMFLVFGLSVFKIVSLSQKHPFLERYRLYLAIIPNLIIIIIIFAIAAMVAAPFLPKDNVEAISRKLLELWDRVSHTVSSIAIALGIFIAILLLYQFLRWIFVIPPP